MRHNVCGRKLNRTKSHRDAMFANMATSLFEYKKLHTTEAKAKELRPFAEALITKAKIALAKEKQKLLPSGQTVDIHNRRLVARCIRNKAVLQELFDAIAPTVETRNGGYCRITKTGTRRGDAARTAIIELVDWSAPIDGAVSLKRKKKKTSTKSASSASTKEISNKKTKTEDNTKTPTIEATETKIDNVDIIEKDVNADIIEASTQETAEATEIKETSTENLEQSNSNENITEENK